MPLFFVSTYKCKCVLKWNRQTVIEFLRIGLVFIELNLGKSPGPGGSLWKGSRKEQGWCYPDNYGSLEIRVFDQVMKYRQR